MTDTEVTFRECPCCGRQVKVVGDGLEAHSPKWDSSICTGTFAVLTEHGWHDSRVPRPHASWCECGPCNDVENARAVHPDRQSPEPPTCPPCHGGAEGGCVCPESPLPDLGPYIDQAKVLELIRERAELRAEVERLRDAERRDTRVGIARDEAAERRRQAADIGLGL